MKKGMMRVASVVMSVTVAMSTFGLGGTTATAAGLPTTDGHDKYVNKTAFDVIGSDSFGTKPLDNPLFDKTKGSSNITNLQVPVLAYDDTSIGVVWNKPEKYDNVADYKVWVNGELKETARENFEKNSAWTATYMKAFYDYYNTQKKSDVEMVNVDIHSFRATNLKPDTEYTIKVVAVDKDGKELGEAQEIKQKTTKTPEVVNIEDYGAKSSEGYTSYNDEINAAIEANTKAIQSAIDACPEGGKVVVPAGKTYVTGALWLKSDMTLEVNGTLWASPNSDHFEIGFLMYPFYTDTRGWGLVNAMSADESAPIKNVRVTGTGTLYGNGWKYGTGADIYQDGLTSNKGLSKPKDDTGKVIAGADTVMAGDPTDTETWGLPRYCGGGNVNVFYQGIQSKDSSYKYLKNTGKYTEAQLQAALDAKTASEASTAGKAFSGDDLKFAYATRSSLLIMRNCENVYVGDITIENPSNHSVNILDSRNIATTNVKVFSYDGNNGDGLGFGCSKDVICWGNFTDTGDDNLGFGASVGEGARDCNIQTNSEIWMFDNFVREGHGGLAAGSHTGNGIQDVLFEDTVMNHIDMAFRFKSAPTNGGFGANITMRDCAVADTNQGWVLTTSYGDPNSASSTEWAEIGEFYNFASYNVTVNTVVNNTIQVLADIDPVGNASKPLHSHHNLYFQDITFGDVGKNGSYKEKGGWETLIGCENSVFYNVKTVSYNSKAVSAKTNKAWSNLQYCNNLIFQGTTMESLGAYTDKMNAAMSPIVVTDNKVTAENVATSGGDSGSSGDEEQGEYAWTVTAKDGFGDAFNDASGKEGITTVPKLNTKADPVDIGYVYDNEYNNGGNSVPNAEIGFSYKGCDVTNLAKIALEVSRQTKTGKQTVSVRLDAKDGQEIASAVLDGSEKEYVTCVMDVTLPEGTTGIHKLFIVCNSTGSEAKYVANFRNISGIKKAAQQPSVELKRESVDLSKGIMAGQKYSTESGVYGTVESLEDAPAMEETGSGVIEGTVNADGSVTIEGITYKQYVQASTAAGAGGLVPDNGTATYVFSPKVDCSVTLHSRVLNSKTYWFVESPDGANVTARKSGTIESVMTFNLKAGNQYYYYAEGSKPMVYGIYFDKPVDDEQATITPVAIASTAVAAETAATAVERKVKLTWTPVTNDTEVFYGVDTYVDGVKVDMVDGIKTPTTTIGRLSSGVTYTFKVYVSEKGDNANSMSTTGMNKTLVGEATITVDGNKDTSAITATNTTVSLASPVYTCAHGTWTNASKQDARVRGYKIYANGTYIKTLYNYQISKYTTVNTVTSQVGRLTPGIDNKVQIVAFTDAGVEYTYPEATIETLKNYDYKSPVWAADAKLTAEVKGSDVVLTWPAATDDTKVGGYRVYVDGKPVYAEANTKAFNPVNGTKTTTETTYTLKNLNLNRVHTITVQAGDSWWKAEEGMGSYDKMAGFNWTVKGLSTQVGENHIIYGDVNGDESVNIQDAVLLKKVCAKMNVQYDKDAADVNVDNQVNILDAVLLLKHCADNKVELGKK